MNKELEQLESKLKQVSLPASSVDRDETLYQSGWAAGVASLGVDSNRKNRGWYWPATSGVLAMLAAVLAVIQTETYRTQYFHSELERLSVIDATIDNRLLLISRTALATRTGSNRGLAPGG